MIGARAVTYFAKLSKILGAVEVTQDGKPVPISAALGAILDEIATTRAVNGQILFVGNGACAAMASHMAADFTKTAKVSAIAFNDAALLTCFANDYGYDQAFARAIEAHGRRARMLFALSSSGASPNIINAAQKARDLGMVVVALSGFEPDNPLRALGHVSVWIPAAEYGLVEVTQQAVLHAILDLAMGWGE